MASYEQAVVHFHRLSFLSKRKAKLGYKKCTENSAANSLSRIPDHLITLSVLETDLWEHLTHEQDEDFDLKLLKQSVRQNPGTIPWYTLKENILYKKGKVVVSKESVLKKDLLQNFLASSAASQERVAKTLGRIKAQFWWDGLKKEVWHFVKECTICQREKYKATKPPGHMKPLPIPEKAWMDVSMDFTEAMPWSEGKEARSFD